MSDMLHVSAVLEGAAAEPPQTGRILMLGASMQPVPADGGALGISVGRLSDSFDNFQIAANPRMEAALRQCRAVASGEAWCAFLAGAFGTGKTHLAIAALKEWYTRERTGYFWKLPDLLAWLRDAVKRGDDADELASGYREGQTLVVFDDLGTENPTDWANETLYRVLDSRYDRRLPTIITTNRDLNLVDGRILSRFHEGLVVCEGRDIRAQPHLSTGAGA